MTDSKQQPAETPEPGDQELEGDDLDSVAGGVQFYEEPPEDEALEPGHGGPDILTPIIWK